jgi:hypothetical protein
MNRLSAQVAQPAGTVADEYGTNTCPLTGSTATPRRYAPQVART